MVGPKKKAKKVTRAQEATNKLEAVMGPVQGQIIDPALTSALFGPNPEFADKPKKKGEAPMMRDRKAHIALVTQSINDQFKGRAVLRTGSQITNVFVLRRPTGITTLDSALGGGLPAGGLTQIIGRYSSGKSYLANLIMASAQKNYGEQFAAAACMTEMRFDKAFAKAKCGLRIPYSEDEIEVFRQINAENGNAPFTPEYEAWLRDGVGTFVEGVGGTAETVLEAAVQLVESNDFQIVLIDSFGALLTAAEAEHEEGLEGKHRGGAAMVVTQFMHRLHAALNLPDKDGRPNTTTVIGVNQYRDNVGAGLYGNPMKVGGGHALAHGKLVDLHVEQGPRIKVAVSANQNVIVGKEINWEILKGKAGCHDGPKGTYSFYFGEHGHGFGIDIYADLLIAGLQAGIIEQAGAWFSYRGEKIGQGKDNVAVYLYQNPEVFQGISKEILKAVGLNFIVKEGV
jgi:recombination protein RecA